MKSSANIRVREIMQPLPLGVGKDDRIRTAPVLLSNERVTAPPVLGKNGHRRDKRHSYLDRSTANFGTAAAVQLGKACNFPSGLFQRIGSATARSGSRRAGVARRRITRSRL